MFCRKCGMQLNEGSVFCSRCGTQAAPVAGLVQSAGDVSPKSRLATSLLAILIGNFGAHRFYTGKILTALLMLVVTVIGWAFYIGAAFAVVSGETTENPWWMVAVAISLFAAVAIWALIDFIIAMTGNFKDSQGRVIRKW